MLPVISLFYILILYNLYPSCLLNIFITYIYTILISLFELCFFPSFPSISKYFKIFPTLIQTYIFQSPSNCSLTAITLFHTNISCYCCISTFQISTMYYLFEGEIPSGAQGPSFSA